MDFQVCIIQKILRTGAEDVLETKVLKQLVRDHIDPSRDLGHSDKHGKKKEEQPEVKSQGAASGGITSEPTEVKRNADGIVCEDCT